MAGLEPREQRREGGLVEPGAGRLVGGEHVKLLEQQGGSPQRRKGGGEGGGGLLDR
jgi:hypothetical protein